jgi:O-acetylserine/cysteine efflux transporter
MRRALAPRDLLLTLAVVTLWGFSFVPIKVGLREMPPFALAALRFFFAAMPLVLVIRRPRMPWRDVAGYGLAIGVVQFGLLFLGMKLGMPAGLSSLVIQMQVFFTIGLAIAFLGDRLQRHNLVGAGIATAGIAILAAQELIAGAHATLVGFALVLVAAFAWGVGNVISKRAAAAHDADMFSLVVWSSLVPPIPLALLSYVFEGGASVWDAVASAGMLTWGCVLVLAWGATLFGFASWAKFAPSLSHRPHRPVRVADSGVRGGQRRDFSRRVARALAGRRRSAGVRGAGGECLRSAHSGLAVSGSLIGEPRLPLFYCTPTARRRVVTSTVHWSTFRR